MRSQAAVMRAFRNLKKREREENCKVVIVAVDAHLLEIKVDGETKSSMQSAASSPMACLAAHNFLHLCVCE